MRPLYFVADMGLRWVDEWVQRNAGTGSRFL